MKTRNAACIIVLMALALPFRAGAEDTEPAGPPSFYLGVNPIAEVVPFTGYANMIFQLLSAEEIGLAVSGGAYVGKRQAIESRLSVGAPNDSTFLLIGSVAWKIFPFDSRNAEDSGFFFGPDLRIGWLDYHAAGISYVHIVPSIEAGWFFLFGNFFLNIRVVQSVAVFTSSSAPGVAPKVSWLFSPWPTLTPVLPVASFDIGYAFR